MNQTAISFLPTKAPKGRKRIAHGNALGSTNTHPTAPTGLHTTAQGNALGRTNTHPTAPTGLSTIAQGNALGMHPTAPRGLSTIAEGNALGTASSSPERATDHFPLSPFQGLSNYLIADQGRRFALPLAILFRPFGAFSHRLSLSVVVLLLLTVQTLAQVPNYGDISVKVETLHTSDVGEGYGEYRATIINFSTKQSHKVTVSLPSFSYDDSGAGIREVRRTVEIAPQSTATLSLFSPAFSSFGSTAVITIDGERQKEDVAITYDKLGVTSGRSSAISLLLSQNIFKTNLFSAANVEQALKDSSGQWQVSTQSHDFPVPEWSQNWMSYARFNGILLSAEELSAAPEAVRMALLHYVERGGMLIVSGNWQPPGQWLARRGAFKDEPVKEDENDSEAEAPPKPAPNSKPQPDLPIYYVGFGSILTTGAVDPKAISVNQWKGIKQELSASRLTVNDFASLANINQDFKVVEKFGVPVRGLFALMLLFVIVIGPVNLLWLAKLKRKIWMLWTIPAISLLTCLIVAGYSLFGEGWNATARTEALTILDETAHRATTIAWTGFYSPITPSDGLHFGYDTELIPQLPSYFDYRRRIPERTLDWTNDQHLESGWVAARIPAFFKLRKTEARRERLNIRQFGNEATLVNGLGADIAQIWWADASGKIHAAENIAAGAQGSLKPTELKAAGVPGSLRETYSGDWLEKFKAIGNKPQQVLMPNSYLAVLNSAPFVEEGLKTVKTRTARNLVYGVGGER